MVLNIWNITILQSDVTRNAEISASPAKLLKIIQIAQAVIKVAGMYQYMLDRNLRYCYIHVPSGKRCRS